ncbi:MAG: YifB family Mg chelatase-like AAA ATPase [Elusimicrobia bacterium]|nr:YifB family Mg chelatase-like AAA ATPase [Elusimicrobiota bacterium]
MLAIVWAAEQRGAAGVLVRVETDLAPGLPRMSVVGLAEGPVREARERVIAAVRNSGYEFPDGRVTVGLAPAELRKGGAQLDLPMALGVLAASGQLVAEPWAASCLVLGELGLDGSVLPAAGVLILAAEARAKGLTRAVVPAANAAEAAFAGLAPLPVRSLREAVVALSGGEPPRALTGPSEEPRAEVAELDLADVRGQALARRALEVAAAGGHNLLLVGPPGTGKSMLAARLPGLLPPLGADEAVEVAKLHGLAGLAGGGCLSRRRPFRAPHSTARPAALLGGGPRERPGELVLAHRGVLFLDELPEFGRDSLECLRQPLEERVVRLARARGFAEYPADCAVVGAMNPCPCGWLGSRARACRCPRGGPERYRGRISGPLLDRLELQVELSPVPFAQWIGGSGPAAESSAAVRERVCRARAAAAARLGEGGTNARSTPAQARAFAALEPDAERLLAAAAERAAFSPRALDRVLRVARTAADLAGAARVAQAHVAEALQYRALDRGTGT